MPWHRNMNFVRSQGQFYFCVTSSWFRKKKLCYHLMTLLPSFLHQSFVGWWLAMCWFVAYPRSLRRKGFQVGNMPRIVKQKPQLFINHWPIGHWVMPLHPSLFWGSIFFQAKLQFIYSSQLCNWLFSRKPTKVTYNASISACEKAATWTMASWLLHHMTRISVSHDPLHSTWREGFSYSTDKFKWDVETSRRFAHNDGPCKYPFWGVNDFVTPKWC